MKMYKFITPILIATIVTSIIWSCSSDNSDGNGTGEDGFNRQSMLANWADNIIVPAYRAYGTDVGALKSASDTFESTPNQNNLDALRTAWEDAYVSWQNVSMFLLGPAETAFLRSFVNTYPTNPNTINNNISSGNYNLVNINLNDAQGFPALDYLLYGLADNDTEILEFYTTNSNASNYINYLTDVTDRIHSLSNQVISAWEGTYRDTFVNNSGPSANSSTNRLVNDWMEYYERIFRNGKIGIPAGVFSDGSPEPEKVEAFYKKDISKTLCLEALNAFRDFFKGNAFSGNGTGESLESYLDFLNTMKDGEDLSQLINNQFDASITSVSGLSDNFYDQINSNNNAMLAAFEVLQANVVLLKSDMFSALSIAVEFDSGDGD